MTSHKLITPMTTGALVVKFETPFYKLQKRAFTEGISQEV